MKRILALLLVAITLFSLLACDNGGGVSSQSETSKTDTSSTDSSVPDTPGSTDTSGSNTDSSTPGLGNEDKPPLDEEGTVFKVYLEYNGDPFVVSTATPITVTWNDGINYKSAQVDENGIASVKGLDGDYAITVKDLPAGYTYNPNIYSATNDNPEITIDIYKLGSTSGSGVSEYKRKVLTKTSMYRATLSSDSQKIFFEFKAEKSGTYTIESWVSTVDDKINPKIDVYTSNFAAPIYMYTLDTGGSEGKNYTKNFKYEVEIADEMISSGGQVVFVFAVYTTARNDKYYPVDVDFAVQYEGGFELEHIKSEFVVPNELYLIMAEKLKEMKSLSLDEFMSEYSVGGMEDEYESAYEELQRLSPTKLSDGLSINVFLNENEVLWGPARSYLNHYFNKYYGDTVGKEWHNPATVINGDTVFMGTDYRYNEKTGFYHKYNEGLYTDTSEEGYGFGYGPILYADISTPLRTGVLDEAFTTVEYRGNKALTVSNGTENYKFFIESYASAQNMSNTVLGGPIECSEDYENLLGYASLVNSDGAVPVTRELMEFLQKYSISQVLFMDGDGWAETGEPPYESTEEDQWLFACGYYE